MGSGGLPSGGRHAGSAGTVRRIHGAEESFDYMPDDPEALREELIRTRTRLKAAESVIDQLGESDDPVEQRLSNLLAQTAEEIERLHAEGRERVEGIVAEAEALRGLARKQNDKAADAARAQVETRAQELLKDADALTASAQVRALKIVEEANRKREKSEKYVDELLAEAESLYRVVQKRAEQVDTQVTDARAKADEVMRNANVAARETRQRAEESARRITDNAEREAAGILQQAKEEAARRLQQIADKGASGSFGES